MVLLSHLLRTKIQGYLGYKSFRIDILTEFNGMETRDIELIFVKSKSKKDVIEFVEGVLKNPDSFLKKNDLEVENYQDIDRSGDYDFRFKVKYGVSTIYISQIIESTLELGRIKLMNNKIIKIDYFNSIEEIILSEYEYSHPIYEFLIEWQIIYNSDTKPLIPGGINIIYNNLTRYPRKCCYFRNDRITYMIICKKEDRTWVNWFNKMKKLIKFI